MSRSSAGREFLAKAFAAKNIDVRVGGPELVPDNVRDLIPYDCVVLSNIPRSSLGDAKMRALARYVREYGGGLVVLGGPGSLGPAYKGTPLEEILPVTMGGGERFGKEEALPLCVIFLMDASGGMGSGSGGSFNAARDAAGELAGSLRPEEMLGLIAFDTDWRVFAPLAPATGGRQGVTRLLGGIVPRGDAAAAKPLEEALRQLRESPCRVKRVILVTDGNTKDLSTYDYRGLIAGYARAGVAISAVDVGGGDDSQFLRALAMGTGGDYTHVREMRDLPLPVLREARRSTVESGFVDGKLVPKVEESSRILDGLRRGQIPEVKGYVVMAAKPGADVALYSDVRGSKDPLLACGRYGRGKTVVWASDAEGNWAGGAADARTSGKFWGRLVRWAMRAR